MKVYVVDNGGQWTHREWRVLRCLGVETRMVPNTTPFGELKGLDGLVLSGGAPNVACDGSRMGNGAEYIDRAEYPVLGICAGMQFMCQRFGSEVGPADTPEFGEVELKVSDHSDLFRGLPDEFIAWGSHNDEVKSVPAGFRVTASSPSCGIEAVACVDRPLYGVQFHPEVENTQHGSEMFRNFLGIIAAQRRRGSRMEGSGKPAPEGRQAISVPAGDLLELADDLPDLGPRVQRYVRVVCEIVEDVDRGGGAHVERVLRVEHPGLRLLGAPPDVLGDGGVLGEDVHRVRSLFDAVVGHLITCRAGVSGGVELLLELVADLAEEVLEVGGLEFPLAAHVALNPDDEVVVVLEKLDVAQTVFHKHTSCAIGVLSAPRIKRLSGLPFLHLRCTKEARHAKVYL